MLVELQRAFILWKPWKSCCSHFLFCTGFWGELSFSAGTARTLTSQRQVMKWIRRSHVLSSGHLRLMVYLISKICWSLWCFLQLKFPPKPPTPLLCSAPRHLFTQFRSVAVSSFSPFNFVSYALSMFARYGSVTSKIKSPRHAINPHT